MKNIILISVAAPMMAMPINEAHAVVHIPTEDHALQDAQCRNEWTKRGVLDDRNYDNCMNEMHQSYMELADFVNQHKDQDWLQSIVDYAQKRWTTRNMRDDRAMSYEIQQQVDGKLDLDYERKQLDWNETKYIKCQHDLNLDANDFHNAMFCYKLDD
jgi:hypothetical protein